MAYKTRSDSLMLMRQIKNLKDLGSDLGGNLETSSRTFLSGVQIVRTGNKPEVCSNVILMFFTGQLPNFTLVRPDSRVMMKRTMNRFNASNILNISKKF